MPSTVLSTRLTPRDHDRLRALAERRGSSLAATAGHLLAAALDESGEYRPPQDGVLVAAVRAVLEDVTAPEAVMNRELAVHLARAIERREPGHLSAIGALRKTVESAQGAQREHDGPDPDDPLTVLLAGLI
ncbi:hypothetical protein AB0N09_21740 [Streptomyces erythrochromogenes]|uniref:hypothetical protein n=1 Tax=Streptomyces erythrochromogenes TaxID=285574 RepID=UPI0034422305